MGGRGAFERLQGHTATRLSMAAALVCMAVVASAPLWPTTASASPVSSTGSRRSAVKLSVLGEVAVANVSPDSVEEPSSVSPLVLLTSSGLVGIDLANGKEVWDTPVPFPVGQKEATVAGGLVFTWPTHASPSPLEALNLTTGKEVWTSPGFLTPEISPGVVATGRTLVTIGTRGVEGLDDANGKPRWTVGQIHGGAPGFPIAADGDRVIVTTQQLATGTASGTDWALAAVDPATHRATWHTASENGDAAALTVGNHVVAVVTQGFGANGQELPDKLYAFDAQSGRRLWSLGLPGDWNFTDPPLVEGGNVIVSTEAGLTPHSGINAVTAYRLQSGRIAWRMSLQSATYVAGEGSTVFLEQPSGSMIAADAATGQQLGSVNLPFGAVGPFYAAGNRLAIVGLDNDVYGVSVEG
jgi:PQQ-like domain